MVSAAFSRVAALLALALLPAAAHAQFGSCKVLDSELQWTYDGACVNGFAEGYGEARGTAHYRGEFKAGRKHGQGLKTWLNGDRYEGYFAEDRREGTGIYTWGRWTAYSNQRYTGGFRNDLRHGYGVYEWPNGDRRAGEWVEGRLVSAPNKDMVDRTRIEAEQAVAVGRVGVKVCRQMEIGVATREWIRGAVTAVDLPRISVRVDDPGTLGHTIDGRVLRKGDVVTDVAKNWVPCV